MYKRLRVIVPAVQVLIFITIVLSEKLVSNDRLIDDYVGPASHIMWRLNFPFYALLLVLDWALSPIGSMSGPPFAAMVFGVMLLLVFVLFWYFVVAEIEMRSNGKSMLRFTGWVSELFTVAVLFCFGVGSVWFAYSDTSWLWFHRSVAAAILGGLLLLMWGAAFIGISVHDLVAFLRMRLRTPKEGTRS
jgi:hypothetical protein